MHDEAFPREERLGMPSPGTAMISGCFARSDVHWNASAKAVVAELGSIPTKFLLILHPYTYTKSILQNIASLVTVRFQNRASNCTGTIAGTPQISQARI